MSIQPVSTASAAGVFIFQCVKAKCEQRHCNRAMQFQCFGIKGRTKWAWRDQYERIYFHLSRDKVCPYLSSLSIRLQILISQIGISDALRQRVGFNKFKLSSHVGIKIRRAVKLVAWVTLWMPSQCFYKGKKRWRPMANGVRSSPTHLVRLWTPVVPAVTSWSGEQIYFFEILVLLTASAK